MLRSCYSAMWRLPDGVDVRGYYYFADDAEFYPGLTHFTSANWHRGDGTPWPEFGERETPRPRWRDGSFDFAHPDLITLGTREQIEGEATVGTETWTLYSGVPSPCWRVEIVIISEVGGPGGPADHLVFGGLASNGWSGSIEQGVFTITLNAASATIAGIVSLEEQHFAGHKHFEDLLLDVHTVDYDDNALSSGSVILASTHGGQSWVGAGNDESGGLASVTVAVGGLERTGAMQIAVTELLNTLSFGWSYETVPSLTLSWGVVSAEGFSGELAGLTFVAGWCVGGDDGITLDRLETGTLPAGVGIEGGTW